MKEFISDLFSKFVIRLFLLVPNKIVYAHFALISISGCYSDEPWSYGDPFNEDTASKFRNGEISIRVYSENVLNDYKNYVDATFGNYIDTLTEESLINYIDEALAAYKIARIGYAFMRNNLHENNCIYNYSEYPDSDDFIPLLVPAVKRRHQKVLQSIVNL